jgi:subtilisin-like proprotein convertase family protein
MGIIGRMHLERMNRTLARRLALFLVLSALSLGWESSEAQFTAAYENPTAISIPALGTATPYPSNIAVAGVPGTITEITVTLTNITHNAPSDIDIMLVAPNGTTNATILSDVGSTNPISNVTLTLDDDAATDLPALLPLTSGTFRPRDIDIGADPDNFVGAAPAESGNVALSTFDGLDPNGTWSLFVVDSFAAESGSIAGGWTLTITTNAPTAARVVTFEGKRYQDGRVLLKWDTDHEAKNLGFRIYRDAGRGLEPVTLGLVAGAALQLGGVTLSSEQSYTWSDNLGDDAGAVQYLLRDVDVRGQGTWRGPIVPETVSGPAPDAQPATLLSQVGQRLRTAAQAVALTAGPRRGHGRGDLAMQQALAAQPAVKISVNQNGWHQVRYEALVEAGLDPTVDPRSLRLYRHGREVAIQVRNALPDRFTTGDRIEFYGEEQDTPNTDASVYWLRAGDGVGLRVPILDRRGEPGGATSFRATVEWRPRGVYFAGLLNGDAPNFFGSPVLSTPLEHSLTLAGVDTNPPGEARRG